MRHRIFRDVAVASIIGLAIFAALTLTARAAKPVQHQHYASFGPWCVSKSTGVMRAVKGVQSCRPDEVRIGHKRIPLDPVPGPQGQRGLPGKAGQAGSAGVAGAKGDRGPAGPAGVAGAQGTAGAQGAAGPAGPQGPKGDPGAAGARGPAGPAGPQGPAGSLAGAKTLTICVSPGGNVKAIHCDPGHDTVYEVLVK